MSTTKDPVNIDLDAAKQAAAVAESREAERTAIYRELVQLLISQQEVEACTAELKSRATEIRSRLEKFAAT